MVVCCDTGAKTVKVNVKNFQSEQFIQFKGKTALKSQVTQDASSTHSKSKLLLTHLCDFQHIAFPRKCNKQT